LGANQKPFMMLCRESVFAEEKLSLSAQWSVDNGADFDHIVIYQSKSQELIRLLIAASLASFKKKAV